MTCAVQTKRLALHIVRRAFSLVISWLLILRVSIAGLAKHDTPTALAKNQVQEVTKEWQQPDDH